MKDKVVVITGGTSGIGRALVEEYANHEAKIVFTGRNQSRMQSTADFLASKGIDYLALPLDVASESSNKELIDKAIEKYGKIDILICNAGISMRARFDELDLKVFDTVMRINFYGTIYGVKYAIPFLEKTKGSIVAISSINGYRGTPDRTAYTASKYAIQGFFESLRLELIEKGIHVLVVNPGFTTSNIRNSALTANGQAQGESPRDETKMMSPEEVAKKVFNAERAKKRDLILTRFGKLVVFLNKRFPGWMDRQTIRVMAKEETNHA